MVLIQVRNRTGSMRKRTIASSWVSLPSDTLPSCPRRIEPCLREVRTVVGAVAKESVAIYASAALDDELSFADEICCVLVRVFAAE